MNAVFIKISELRINQYEGILVHVRYLHVVDTERQEEQMMNTENTLKESIFWEDEILEGKGLQFILDRLDANG